MRHARAGRGVNQLREDVVQRLHGRRIQIQGDQIRALARFDGTGAFGDAERLGTAEGGRFQHVPGWQRHRVRRRALRQQRSQPRFREQVEAVVGGGAVGAEGDHRALGAELRQRADAARQLHVRVRAVDHAHAAAGGEADFVVAHRGHVDGLQVFVQQADGVEQANPSGADAGARIGHFGRGLVQMDVDAGFGLVGEHGHPPQRLLVHGVGGVGAEAGGDEIVVAEAVVQRQALVEAVVDALRVGVRNRRDGEGRLQAEAGFSAGFGGDFGEEVHVRGGGGAAGDHLGDRQAGAVAHEVGVHPALLQRPDGLREPGVQGLRLAQAAQQRHRQVAVGVDEARHQGVAVQLHPGRVREARRQLGATAHGEDFAAAHGHRGVLEGDVSRRDGEQQTRFEHVVRVACRGVLGAALGRLGHPPIIAPW